MTDRKLLILNRIEAIRNTKVKKALIDIVDAMPELWEQQKQRDESRKEQEKK